MTAHEMAAYPNAGPRSLWRMVREGKVRPVRVAGRIVRIDRVWSLESARKGARRKKVKAGANGRS